MAPRDWESPDPDAAQKGIAAWLALAHVQKGGMDFKALDNAWLASLLPSHEVVHCEAKGTYALSLGNAYYCGLTWPMEVKPTGMGRTILALQLQQQPTQALAQRS